MTTRAALLESVTSGLREIAAVRELEDGVRVTTHCMYPSNGLVEVIIRGGRDTIVASDDGGAVGDALSAGIAIKDIDRSLRHLIKDQGLSIKDGVIFTPRMPLSAAPLAVLLVANAAKEVAGWLYDHSRVKRSRDFKILLAEFLKRSFDERVRLEVIVGRSDKPHTFPNVISLATGRRLIIDPVANESSSVNSRVIANMDVRELQRPDLDQRIIYDDEEIWKPADLNLLQFGATVVPFSRSSEVIERIAALG